MFSRELAVEYAQKWAYSYNPEFYNFTNLGGDCTNFVSQCLYYGGYKMNFSTYGWFYISLNNRAPAFTGVNEFWNFATKNTGDGVQIKQCSLNEVEIADVIQLFNGNRFYHTLIVSDIRNGQIKVCSHDVNALNIPLNYYNYLSLRCGKLIF